MANDSLHPIACKVLEVFATEDYFCSKRLAITIAEHDPQRCLQWASGLVKHRVFSSQPPAAVAELLETIDAAIQPPQVDALTRLDELSWACWYSGSFDSSLPRLQGAVARLGWASMFFICHTTGVSFASSIRDFRIPSSIDRLPMANQCASAIDMTYTHTDDGRLFVAASFSREMEALSQDTQPNTK